MSSVTTQHDDDPRLTVYLPEDRRMRISPWGIGNPKLGEHVYTYSLTAGRVSNGGSCPGATEECLNICYALKIKHPILMAMYDANTEEADAGNVTELPPGAKLVRIHVSGDFINESYLRSWNQLIKDNPDVQFWVYTRSWRVPGMLPLLNELRKRRTNVEVFASVDSTIPDIQVTRLQEDGWRIAWFDDDPRKQGIDCLEETGKMPDCESCGYCCDARSPGTARDVIVTKH